MADGTRFMTPRHAARSGNSKLGPDGASAVASALTALTALTALDIRWASVREKGVDSEGFGGVEREDTKGGGRRTWRRR